MRRHRMSSTLAAHYGLLRDTGDLAVGDVRLIATSPVMLIRLSQAFNARHPNVTCHFKFGNSEEVLKSVLECESDLGILGGAVEHEDCIAVPVANGPPILAADDERPILV